jgi:hypothetical protein
MRRDNQKRFENEDIIIVLSTKLVSSIKLLLRV